MGLFSEMMDEAHDKDRDVANLRKQLSQVAKALAWQSPYQASLAERAAALIAERDALKVERDRWFSEALRLKRELDGIAEFCSGDNTKLGACQQTQKDAKT